MRKDGLYPRPTVPATSVAGSLYDAVETCRERDTKATVPWFPPAAGLTHRPGWITLAVMKHGETLLATHAANPRVSLESSVGLAICAVITMLAAGLASAPALAALYKWTDANGRVIYSDQAPPGNVKVEIINAPPPPANPNAVKDLAVKDAELKKSKQTRAEEEAKANKARVEANQQRENCERARAQMFTLGNSDQVVLYSTNAQGERVPMSDEVRLRERLRLDAWIRDNCKN